SFYAVTSTRLFDVSAMGEFRKDAVTFTRSGWSATADLAHPTYYWSEKLVEQLGSILDVEDFFYWMVRAFLIKDPARSVPVLDCRRAHAPARAVSRLLEDRPLPPVDTPELPLPDRAYVSRVVQGLREAPLPQLEELYASGSGSGAVTAADLLFRHLVAQV